MPKRFLLALVLAAMAAPVAANQVPGHPPPSPKRLREMYNAEQEARNNVFHEMARMKRQKLDLTFPLWPDAAPGALGSSSHDIPTLTCYVPVNTSGALRPAMIVCPGGGYMKLAPHEGEHYARWLTDRGIVAFVLKYRLGTNGYRHPAMLQDAARAMRVVRARAGEWGVDPQRVGMMGSSAGGHVTSLLITHFDAGETNAPDVVERESSRPDLAVLCYPVITFGDLGHKGSKAILLGTNPPPGLAEELSSERHVSSNTPPCFIWHTADDQSVPVANSLNFAAALKRAGVECDLRIYEHGKHGLGLGTRDGYDAKNFLPWTFELASWLQNRGWIPSHRGR